MSDQPKAVGTIPSSVVRDFETIELKLTTTVWPAFRDGLPDGHPLRDAIHEAKWAVLRAGRLLAMSLDPELAKVAPPNIVGAANSAPNT